MEIQGNPVGSRMIKENMALAAGAPRADTGKADSAAAGPGGGARVNLSEKARGMMALRGEVDAAPNVRQGLVAHISQRIAAGTYNVRGQLVAEAMVRNAAFEAIA